MSAVHCAPLTQWLVVLWKLSNGVSSPQHAPLEPVIEPLIHILLFAEHTQD